MRRAVRPRSSTPWRRPTASPRAKGCTAILPLRDVIAASVELMVDANRFDGIVMLCSCDKIVPGMLMAAARLDLPTIFVTGGPMLPGHAADPTTGAEREIILSDVKEAMGRYKAGRITEEQFYEIECKACGGPGACAFMGTANTMNCIVEALGLSLPGCATLPALDPDRADLCRAQRPAHRRAGPRGRACRSDAHPGEPGERGARHAGARRVDQRRAAPAGHRQRDRRKRHRHHTRHLRPPGPADAADRQVRAGQPAHGRRPARGGWHPGGPQRVGAAARPGHADGGRPHDRRNRGRRPCLRDDVLHPLDAPIATQGGIAVLRGNLAPDGAVVKQSAVAPAMHHHIGPRASSSRRKRSGTR